MRAQGDGLMDESEFRQLHVFQSQKNYEEWFTRLMVDFFWVAGTEQEQNPLFQDEELKERLKNYQGPSGWRRNLFDQLRKSILLPMQKKDFSKEQAIEFYGFLMGLFMNSLDYITTSLKDEDGNLQFIGEFFGEDPQETKEFIEEAHQEFGVIRDTVYDGFFERIKNWDPKAKKETLSSFSANLDAMFSHDGKFTKETPATEIYMALLYLEPEINACKSRDEMCILVERFLGDEKEIDIERFRKCCQRIDLKGNR